MSRRIAARGIAVQENKIFCVRLKPYRYAEASEYWCTPGGGVDEGEALIPALEREIQEELGIKARIGRLLYVQQFNYKEQDQMEFFFHIENNSDFETIDLSKTANGEEEIAEYGFIDPKNHTLLPKFLKEVDVSEHIAQNKPAEFFNYL